jgi:hypothetical protein
MKAPTQGLLLLYQAAAHSVPLLCLLQQGFRGTSPAAAATQLAGRPAASHAAAMRQGFRQLEEEQVSKEHCTAATLLHHHHHHHVTS